MEVELSRHSGVYQREWLGIYSQELPIGSLRHPRKEAVCREPLRLWGGNKHHKLVAKCKRRNEEYHKCDGYTQQSRAKVVEMLPKGHIAIFGLAYPEQLKHNRDIKSE